MRTGKFLSNSGAPICTALCAMGLPATKAKAMQALITPANTDTHTPLTKLKSLTGAFFCSSGTSCSFRMPASLHRAIPARHTSTPPSTIYPESVANIPPSFPANMGGMAVPKVAQKPSASA